MYKALKIIILSCCLMMVSNSLSQGFLDDPKTRNEDITNTKLKVNVELNNNGHYVYSYNLTNPSENLGTLGGLRINIECNKVDEYEKLFLESYDSDEFDPEPNLNTYSPVAILGTYGVSYLWGVSANKDVMWGIQLKPDSTGILQLISPFPPVLREYKIAPAWGDNHFTYDYSEVEDDQEDIPWVDDFTLSGMIEAPGCSTDVVESVSEYGIFKGSSKYVESESENENLLLTFTSPILENPHYSNNTNAAEFTIHYAQDIASQTFEAKVSSLKKKEIEQLFNPVPGTIQTITIPFKQNKKGKKKLDLNIEFKVNAVCDAFITDDADDKTLEKCEKEGNKNFKDTDKFTIKLEKPVKEPT